mmetsp:Transcript_421/g.1969  ORF Transcript_421/g.1969 Transcript_421/m.1969 type:complete len:418 (-) Transcript_421:1120-2373(-)
MVMEQGHGRDPAAVHPSTLGPDAWRERPGERRRPRGSDVAKVQVELLHSRVAHPLPIRPRGLSRLSRRAHPLVLVESAVTRDVRRAYLVRAVGDPPRREGFKDANRAFVADGVELESQRSKHSVEHPRAVRVPPAVQRGRKELGTLRPDGRVAQVKAGDPCVELPVPRRVQHRYDDIVEALLQVRRPSPNHLRRRGIPVAGAVILPSALGPAVRGQARARRHRPSLHRLPLPTERLHRVALAVALRQPDSLRLLLRAVPRPRQLHVRGFSQGAARVLFVRVHVHVHVRTHPLPRGRLLLGGYDDRGARLGRRDRRDDGRRRSRTVVFRNLTLGHPPPLGHGARGRLNGGQRGRAVLPPPETGQAQRTMIRCAPFNRRAGLDATLGLGRRSAASVPVPRGEARVPGEPRGCRTIVPVE